MTTPSSSDPDVIRAQIEQTRQGLSYDVDALNEKVNPARVVDRRVTAAKGRLSRVKDSVMGGAHDGAASTKQSAADTTGAVSDAASSAVATVQQAPDAVVRQAQGNPLAAGLIAFGVGWLVASLIPASEREQQLAQQAESAVRENKDALLAPAKQAAQEVGEQLKPVAQHAVEEVKSTAQDAAATVQDEGQSAVSEVQGKAKKSKQKVQQAGSN